MNITSSRSIAILIIVVSILLPASVFALKAVFYVGPVDGYAPLTVNVAEASGDPEIVDWKFDFGDGTIITKQSRAEHTYEKPGEYILELAALDAKGLEQTDKTVISVYGPEFTPTPRPTETPEEPEKQPDEFTTQKIIYQGATPIKDAIGTKSASESVSTLKTATITAMSKETYPYFAEKPIESKTDLKIIKYRCDEKMGICGYWIEAYRDNREVAVNNPIWIRPSPYLVMVSSTYDAKLNEETITLKEDPKLAIERTLQRYVDDQPLGKAVTGTKE